MSFRTESTLAGYARAAVDLKARMTDYTRGLFARQYLQAFLETRHTSPAGTGAVPSTVLATFDQLTHLPWKAGDPYVLAPAMTAIVAAAAEALDLTGEVVPDDIAPSDGGVLFLPEPIYHRGLRGEVTSIGAVTWARFRNTDTGRSGWCLSGWADRDDPLDPAAARRRRELADVPGLAAGFGPYVLNAVAELPIGTPVAARPEVPVLDDADIDWEPAPDGRFCLDETVVRLNAVVAIVYAFWLIQAQPVATVAAPPLDRAARRRAHRAGVTGDARVVMLRRTRPAADRADGEPKWHYRVRFFVRGHWRRLTTPDGQTRRIWIHTHIKGPDGAPLLRGEKVAVLAR
jgi:hypothetical protein